MLTMRVVSRIFFWLGLAAIIGAGIYYGFQPGWATYTQFIQLSAVRSAPFVNPLYGTGIAAVILLAGGFFLGLGIGMIRKKKTPPAQPGTPPPPTVPPTE